MHVLFNSWFYFCRPTQTIAAANGNPVGSRCSTFHALTFTAAAVDLCDAPPRRRFTPGLTRRPLGREGGGCVGGAHVSIAHSLPSLMCLNQSGFGAHAWHSPDIMEFPLLCSSYLRDSSFDISHGWLPLRGSPPTTPPAHTWTDYEEGHLVS